MPRACPHDLCLVSLGQPCLRWRLLAKTFLQTGSLNPQTEQDSDQEEKRSSGSASGTLKGHLGLRAPAISPQGALQQPGRLLGVPEEVCARERKEETDIDGAAPSTQDSARCREISLFFHYYWSFGDPSLLPALSYSLFLSISFIF